MKTISKEHGDAAVWKRLEAQQEISQAAQKSGELKTGLLAHLPVEHRQIIYRRISAIIYRPHPHAPGFQMQVELLDKCGGSVTIAAPKEVHVLASSATPDPVEIGGDHLRRITELKAAMRQALTAKYCGIEHRRISAIFIRSEEPGQISLELELVKPSGYGITIAPESKVYILDHMWNRQSGETNGESGTVSR